MVRRKFVTKDCAIDYIFHESFERPDARTTFETMLKDGSNRQSMRTSYGRPNRLDGVLGLEAAQPLSADEEKSLFLAMNYWKHRAALLARGNCNSIGNGRQICTMLGRANAYRNRIVQANLRLVYQIARKFSSLQLTTEELYSEGCLKLIRAVELFDVSRGYRFSTYATHTVRNHFLRIRQKAAQDVERLQSQDPVVMADVAQSPPSDASKPNDSENQTAIRKLFGGLSQQETRILKERFGFNESRKVKSYAQIAADFNLSKEWVRQLTLRALERLRHPSVSTESAA